MYQTICDGSQMGFWFHHLIMYETSSLFLITELVVFKSVTGSVLFTSLAEIESKEKKEIWGGKSIWLSLRVIAVYFWDD